MKSNGWGSTGLHNAKEFRAVMLDAWNTSSAVCYVNCMHGSEKTEDVQRAATQSLRVFCKQSGAHVASPFGTNAPNDSLLQVLSVLRFRSDGLIPE
jgi:hypothetical protein